MYNASFIHLGTLGIILTLLFPACGVLRLAKFNVHGHKNTSYFSGLPITAAGGILAVLATYHENIPSFVLVILSLLLSFVMVSNYKYPNFKKTHIPKHAYIVTPILGIGIYFFKEFYPQHFVFIISILIFLYVLFLIYQIKLQIKQQKEKEKKKKDDNIFE
jgi:CDP-diacylglycerol--serine O-phosphatidyltransferase